ncbi:SLATT domain-containing protein [Maridesulfovibrio sp.]|uniref:SLATT domain-containing protein n=1 Tax=Maridesulfovibrio sp. TaxID=2795000 RepID=UPI002A18E3A3|nr:SLATT domain-containing protein [Maridesulfovibrio sp.]
MGWVDMTYLLGNHESEGIKKLNSFRDELKRIKWVKGDEIESLSLVFNALDALAEEKLQYYYGRRKRQALLSIVFRSLGWAAGFVGVVLPFLSDHQFSFDPNGKLGYVFLVAAASFLGANTLFGGTSGHVRYATTQFKLEQLVVSTRLDWLFYKSRVSAGECSSKEVGEGFEILQKYSQEFYSLVIGEAGDWGESVLEELVNYQRSVDKKSKLPDGS